MPPGRSTSWPSLKTLQPTVKLSSAGPCIARLPEKLDHVLKDQHEINAASNQLCIYLTEFISQMTNATAKAAPAQHAVAEAKYDHDLGDPFSGFAVYHLLTATAEKQTNMTVGVEQSHGRTIRGC